MVVTLKKTNFANEGTGLIQWGGLAGCSDSKTFRVRRSRKLASSTALQADLIATKQSKRFVLNVASASTHVYFA